MYGTVTEIEHVRGSRPAAQRWLDNTENNGAVLEEEHRRQSLGEDVSRVVLPGDAEEDDGEAEDRPPDHGVAGRHPARSLVDALAHRADLHRARVRE